MFLRLFNQRGFIGVLLFAVAGILLWGESLLVPQPPPSFPGESSMPFYAWLAALFQGETIWPRITAFGLIITNSLIISWLNTGFNFMPGKSWLPSLVYLLAVSAEPDLQTLHPAHLATLFILLTVFFIFGTYNNRSNEVPWTFNASFSLAIATLFYFPAIVLLPLIWISMFVLQKSDNWRVMVVPFWGFLAPWLLVTAVAFLTDNLVKWSDAIINDLFSVNNQYLFNIYFLSLTGLVVLLAAFGSIAVIASGGVKKIMSRKFFVIFYWMVGLIMIAAVTLRSAGPGIIALLSLPTTYFISYFFIFGKRNFWREALFFIYIATMVASYFLMPTLRP